MTFFLVVFVCIAAWLWSWGTLNAEFMAIWYGSDHAREQYRNGLAISCFFALLPPTWIASPFVTGFYRHGWSLSFQDKPEGE